MEIRVLGPLQIGGAERTGSGSERDRAFLGELVAHWGEPVGYEHLAWSVWRERAPADPRNAVQVRISRLRGLIGPESIATGPSGYALRGADVDAVRFRELVRTASSAAGEEAVRVLDEALSLWRGRAFADMPSSPCTDTEAFALQEARLVAIEDRAEASLALGRHAELPAALRPVLSENPLRERLRGPLMLALYRSGLPAEALELYRAGRAESVRELGLEPGPALRRLHESILAGDPALGAPSPVTARAAPVPRQLPSGVSDFVGRADQVDGIARVLTTPADAVPVAAVAGMGGFGKTSLAIRVAHRVREAFPGGQLFADLRGTRDIPRPPSDVLVQFIRALDGEGALPAAEDELAVLYRSLLAGRRILIVLDDAADAAQVGPLLPGYQGSAALVTSRRRLGSLDGVHSFDLAQLAPDQARELFAGIVGLERTSAEPAATETVLAVCAGMPLAIRLAGARLATRPDWSVADLARRLHERGSQLDELTDGDRSVRASLEASYVPLSPVAVLCLRHLGLWDGALFGLAEFTALAGVHPDEAEAVLGSLIEANLVDTPEPGRYRLHDLVRQFVGERVLAEESEQDRDAAIRRLLAWYVHAADNARRAIRPGRDDVVPSYDGPGAVPAFTDRTEALAWLDRERENLTALAERAARREMHDLVWYVPLVLGDVCHLRGYWREWLALCSLGLRSARQLPDRHPEAVIANLAGVACLSLRRLEEAVEHFSRVAELVRASGDRLMEGFVLNNLGATFSALGENRKAVPALTRALAIGEEVDSAHVRGGALNNLARIDAAEGRLDTAARRFSQARETYRASGRSDTEGQVLTELAGVHRRLGREAEALDTLRQAVEALRDGGNRPGQAVALRELGDTLRRMGDAAQARSAWAAAHELLVAIASPDAAEIRARIAALDA